MNSFVEFGISTFGLEREDFEIEGTQLSIGVPPVQIDFLTSLPGLQFQSCWENREIDRTEEISIFFLSRSDLITAKEKSGRPQDLADIDEMRKADS